MTTPNGRAPRARVAITLLAGALAVGASLQARPAQAGTEQPAGILIFPRIEADSAAGVDTMVQITNVRTDAPVGLLCIYTNALGFCGGPTGAVCRTAADCPGSVACVKDCPKTDFLFRLSPGQTLGFRADQGLAQLPTPQFPVPNPGAIVATPTDPFLGQLTCVQTDPVTELPVARNDLIGSATIVRTSGPDLADYSAIGIESSGYNDGDETLCLGSNATGDCVKAEYARCPEVLTLNHFFDGASVAGARVENELMLVRCSQSFGPPQPAPTRVELLVVNEFEERRCDTLSVACLGAVRFGDHPLFSIGVQGTPAGQTRLRAVPGSEDTSGRAVLGVALERYVASPTSTHSAAHHLTSEAHASQAEIIRIELPGAMPVVAGGSSRIGTRDKGPAKGTVPFSRGTVPRLRRD